MFTYHSTQQSPKLCPLSVATISINNITSVLPAQLLPSSFFPSPLFTEAGAIAPTSVTAISAVFGSCPALTLMLQAALPTPVLFHTCGPRHLSLKKSENSVLHFVSIFISFPDEPGTPVYLDLEIYSTQPPMVKEKKMVPLSWRSARRCFSFSCKPSSLQITSCWTIPNHTHPSWL